MYLFNPTLALSLFMGKGKRCSTSFLIIGWAGNWIVVNKAFTWVGSSGCQLQFIPMCRSIPQAMPVQSQAVTPGSSSPCAAVALSQLSQLLLMLINLIRIIDQVVCRKWEAKYLPQDPSEQLSRGCHAEGTAGAVLQRE